jgi:hypothetical protein
VGSDRACLCLSIHLKTETDSSLLNAVFLIKERTMDNVQNCERFSVIETDLLPWNIVLTLYRSQHSTPHSLLDMNTGHFSEKKWAHGNLCWMH